MLVLGEKVEYVEIWGGPVESNVLLSGEMLNVECFGEKLGTPPPYLRVPPPEKKIKIFNIFNISAVLSIFGFNMPPPQNSTYSTFPLKEAQFVQKVLLSAETLNMLNSKSLGLRLIGKHRDRPERHISVAPDYPDFSYEAPENCFFLLQFWAATDEAVSLTLFLVHICQENSIGTLPRPNKETRVASPLCTDHSILLQILFVSVLKRGVARFPTTPCIY